jgi:hypothetical protein
LLKVKLIVHSSYRTATSYWANSTFRNKTNEVQKIRSKNMLLNDFLPNARVTNGRMTAKNLSYSTIMAYSNICIVQENHEKHET